MVRNYTQLGNVKFAMKYNQFSISQSRLIIQLWKDLIFRPINGKLKITTLVNDVIKKWHSTKGRRNQRFQNSQACLAKKWIFIIQPLIQHKHNNMHFDAIPPNLQNLTTLETALISKISVIMKVTVLKYGMLCELLFHYYLKKLELLF